jgi:hypothetical protein
MTYTLLEASDSWSMPHMILYTLPEDETYSVPFAAGHGTAVAAGFALEEELGASTTGTVEEPSEAEAEEPGGTIVILEDVGGGEFPSREPPTDPGFFVGLRVCEPNLRKQFPPASRIVE